MSDGEVFLAGRAAKKSVSARSACRPSSGEITLAPWQADGVDAGCSVRRASSQTSTCGRSSSRPARRPVRRAEAVRARSAAGGSLDWSLATAAGRVRRRRGGGAARRADRSRPPTRGRRRRDPLGVGARRAGGGARRGREHVCRARRRRPVREPTLFDAVVAAVRAGADGAVPACRSPTRQAVDADGAVVATLDRARLVAVQTPQAFRADALRAAHAGGARPPTTPRSSRRPAAGSWSSPGETTQPQDHRHPTTWLGLPR